MMSATKSKLKYDQELGVVKVHYLLKILWLCFKTIRV